MSNKQEKVMTDFTKEFMSMLNPEAAGRLQSKGIKATMEVAVCNGKIITTFHLCEDLEAVSEMSRIIRGWANFQAAELHNHPFTPMVNELFFGDAQNPS